jgi:hypothetical protein
MSDNWLWLKRCSMSVQEAFAGYPLCRWNSASSSMKRRYSGVLSMSLSSLTLAVLPRRRLGCIATDCGTVQGERLALDLARTARFVFVDRSPGDGPCLELAVACEKRRQRAVAIWTAPAEALTRWQRILQDWNSTGSGEQEQSGVRLNGRYQSISSR